MAKSTPAEKRALDAPPNYSDRTTQWRLLGIVGMVMAVILLIKYGVVGDLWGLISGRPEVWAQFTGKKADLQVDTKLPRTVAGESPLAEPSIDGNAAGPSKGETTPNSQETPDKESTPAAVSNEPGWLPGLDPESLKVVDDNSVIRGQENDAWYGLCALVAKTAPVDLAKHSLGPVRFVQIYQQPTFYRGKIVTISGRIRSVEKLEASKNSHDVGGYTKCVMLPSDGSNSPIFFYLMEMPADFPAGKGVDEAVTIHGVFYKRLAYLATDVPRTAPLLVARSFHWTPAVPKPPEEVPWLTLAVLVVISAILGVTIAIVALRRLAPPNDDLPSDWDGLPKDAAEK